MDGPRDCHIEGNKSEREKQKFILFNAYMWNQEKMAQMITFAKQKQRHRCREQTYGCQGEREGCEELGDWDLHIYIIDSMYKIDNK